MPCPQQDSSWCQVFSGGAYLFPAFHCNDSSSASTSEGCGLSSSAESFKLPLLLQRYPSALLSLLAEQDVWVPEGCWNRYPHLRDM